MTQRTASQHLATKAAEGFDYAAHAEREKAHREAVAWYAKHYPSGRDRNRVVRARLVRS